MVCDSSSSVVPCSVAVVETEEEFPAKRKKPVLKKPMKELYLCYAKTNAVHENGPVAQLG